MSRRQSVTSVLDVSSLQGYYGRMDVFASFTDDGEFDRFGIVDGNIRPEGVFAYMVNDVVGRRSRESTLYSRVFRYKVKSNEALEVSQYRIDDYELHYQKLVKLYPQYEEELDLIYTLVPGQLRIKTAFNHLWQLTFRLATKMVRGIKEIRKQWSDILIALKIYAIVDKSGSGVISKNRRPCFLVVGDDESNIEDLEIVSTQKYKKEQNSRIYNKIARFNRLVKVSNARRRIKKW